MVKMGTVWDRAAEFLTDNLPAILPIALFAFFVPLSIMGSLGPVLSAPVEGLIYVLWIIVFALAALVNWGALTLIAMALERDAEPGRIAARRLVPALTVWIAIGAALALLSLPVALTLRAGGGEPGTLSIPLVVAWPLMIYVVAAIIGAVWVLARLILVYPLVVAENRWFGAVWRSWALTRGIALRVVGVILLYFLVTIVGMLATQTVFGSIFKLIAGPDGGLSLSSVLTSVMVAVVGTAFTVLVPVFTAKLYLALIAAERDRAAAP
ncbi:MAG: hypothetical protein V4574_15985 [Pseudomonadota bacterium]